jgi:preprotein translocase subunit SecG
MVPVLITIHVFVVLAIIGVVLLQRSEGGAVLSGGSFMTGRGAANALTRTTSVLAAIFFATSLSLAIIAARGEKARSIVEELTGAPGSGQSGAPTTTEDLLRSLGGGQPEAAPDEALGTAPTAPAEPAPAASDEPASQSAPEEAAPAPDIETPNP